MKTLSAVIVTVCVALSSVCHAYTVVDQNDFTSDVTAQGWEIVTDNITNGDDYQLSYTQQGAQLDSVNRVNTASWGVFSLPAHSRRLTVIFRCPPAFRWTLYR